MNIADLALRGIEIQKNKALLDKQRIERIGIVDLTPLKRMKIQKKKEISEKQC